MPLSQFLGSLGSIAGAVIGRPRSSPGVRLAREQMAAQKEFAQHGVRWKAEDARAAGLHPLFALSAQTPSFSPVQIPFDQGTPGLAEAGQDLGRAIGAAVSPTERHLRTLAIKSAEADLMGKHAEIDLINAQAAKARQDALYSKPIHLSAGPDIVIDSPDVVGRGGVQGNVATSATGARVGHEGWPWLNPGAITPEAPVVPAPSEAGNRMAGTPLAFRQFRLASGMPILLPGGMQGSAEEALESLSESWTLMRAVYLENVREYGSQWGEEFIRRYFVGEHNIRKFKEFISLDAKKQAWRDRLPSRPASRKEQERSRLNMR